MHSASSLAGEFCFQILRRSGVFRLELVEGTADLGVVEAGHPAQKAPTQQQLRTSVESMGQQPVDRYEKRQKKDQIVGASDAFDSRVGRELSFCLNHAAIGLDHHRFAVLFDEASEVVANPPGSAASRGALPREGIGENPSMIMSALGCLFSMARASQGPPTLPGPKAKSARGQRSSESACPVESPGA
jgi:hypothetical protein